MECLAKKAALWWEELILCWPAAHAFIELLQHSIVVWELALGLIDDLHHDTDIIHSLLKVFQGRAAFGLVSHAATGLHEVCDVVAHKLCLDLGRHAESDFHVVRLCPLQGCSDEPSRAFQELAGPCRVLPLHVVQVSLDCIPGFLGLAN